MALTATGRWPAHCRAGNLDRSVVRDGSKVNSSSNLTTDIPACDGSLQSEAASPQKRQSKKLSPNDNLWTALPEAERQRLGRLFSRLLLFAVRLSAHLSDQEEN